MVKCDLARNSRNFEKLVQQPFLTCDGDYARGNWFNKKEEYLWVVRWRQIWWVLIRIGDKIRLISDHSIRALSLQNANKMNDAMDRKQWKVDLLCNIICWCCFQDFSGHSDDSLPSIMIHDSPFKWTLDSKSVQFIEYFLSDAFSMPFDIVQMSCGKRILSWNARARYAL